MRRRLALCALPLLALPFAFGVSTMNAETTGFTPLELDANARLEKASDWLVRNGLYVLRFKDKDFLKAKLRDLGPVQLWVDPVVNRAGALALLKIKAGGYNYDIEAVWRTEADGRTYDFWMVQGSSQDFVTPMRRCLFYVTLADDKDQRRVLEKSDSFIPHYVTPDGARLILPQDDLTVQYRMRAWRFPECFPGSAMATRKVDHDANGVLTQTPAAPPDR